MKNFFLAILIVVLIGLSGFIILSFILPKKEFVIEKESQLASASAFVSGLNRTKVDDSSITLLAVGDIMLDRGVEHMVYKQGKGDFRFPFLRIVDELQKADILFGNLESIISDKGWRMGSKYSFRASPEAIKGLVYAGFDVLSVANNHLFDYGRYGIEDCFQRLKQANIDYVGAGANEQEVRSGIAKEIKGTKITFLAYTNKGSQAWKAKESSLGLGWLDEDIEEDIKKAKQKSDIVIVSFHTGDEYRKEINGEQRYFSHLAINSGADLVIGHHPHVVQPVEKYKHGWIAYSLGNFVFDQFFSQETMEGLLLEVIIENKRIKEVNPKKIKISEFYQPYIDKH